MAPSVVSVILSKLGANAALANVLKAIDVSLADKPACFKMVDTSSKDLDSTPKLVASSVIVEVKPFNEDIL